MLLDLGHGGRPRYSLELLVEHDVVRVEVAQVVRRDHPERVEQAARQRHIPGERIAVIGQELREHVGPADADATNPGEVVEPDLVDDDLGRRDAEQGRELALEPDRDVAETDRPMAGIE